MENEHKTRENGHGNLKSARKLYILGQSYLHHGVRRCPIEVQFECRGCSNGKCHLKPETDTFFINAYVVGAYYMKSYTTI